MTTKDYQTRRPLRIFLSYFRPHRGLFLLDISCAFFIAVIDLAFPPDLPHRHVPLAAG